MDLQTILNRFTEVKLEEDVLKERLREIRAEKYKLLNQLKEINKVDINRRMDELLPYYLEYEFLKKNLEEAEEIDSLTDDYTDINTDENEEDFSVNSTKEVVPEEKDVCLDKDDLSYGNTVDEIADLPEENKVILTEEKTEPVIEKNEEVITENNEYSYKDKTEDDDIDNLEDNSTDEDFSKDSVEHEVAENETEDNTNESTDNNTDNSEDKETENEVPDKQRRLFKDLSIEEKKEYLVSMADLYRSKVTEIMEFWNMQNNPDEKNKGLVILKEVREAKGKIYSEENQDIIEEAGVEEINEVLVNLRKSKNDIEVYAFEKNREDIKNK